MLKKERFTAKWSTAMGQIPRSIDHIFLVLVVYCSAFNREIFINRLIEQNFD